MNPTPVWQCLSVTQFLEQVNWDGRLRRPGKSGARSRSAGQRVAFSGLVTDWGSLHVQDFFKAQNWMGQPLESELYFQANEDFVPTLTTSVQDFMRYLPWEGQPEVATLPKIQLNPKHLGWAAPKDALSLNDLSDLF